MSFIDIKYKELDLRVEYTYHPEQKGGLEVEPIEAYIEIEEVTHKGNDKFLEVIEALDDVDELTNDVWNSLAE